MTKLQNESRNDLKPFNMANLNEIRAERAKKRYAYIQDVYEPFWNELEAILKTSPSSKKDEWVKLANDDVVLGEVWRQDIGEFYYNHTVHRFSYLYVESQGLVIDKHGHEEPANNGKQVRQIKEWYFFTDGSMQVCKKDEKHKLINDFGEPIYVLSVRICSNGTR